jgi:hypothetical protein
MLRRHLPWLALLLPAIALAAMFADNGPIWP